MDVSRPAKFADGSNLTKEQVLVEKLLGNGVKVSNVSYTGASNAVGTFSTTNNIIGFQNGILLSTGSIHNVSGPNNYTGISQSNGIAGDTDLDSLIPGYDTYDAAVLEFDFTPSQNFISFKYVFASDEYNEYVNYAWNDVFGFFLNGQNIAFVPGTTYPVSINNVNGGNPIGTNASNPQFYFNNENSLIDTEMDGITTVLNVTASVVPNTTNHIKLCIADAGDNRLDSNVFIMADSFSSTALTAPSNFYAIPSYRETSLSWNQVLGAEYYNIYRCKAHMFDFGGGDWEKIGAAEDYTSINGRCSYSDQTEVPGTKYHYVVKAVRGPLEGPASKTITETSPELVPPGGIKLSVSGTDVTLSWNYANVLDYNLYRLKKGDIDWVKIPVSDTNYIDGELLPNTTYYYALTSVYSNEESKWSKSYNITTKEGDVNQITLPNGLLIYIDQQHMGKMNTLLEDFATEATIIPLDYGLSKVVGTHTPLFDQAWGVLSFGNSIKGINYDTVAIQTFAYSLQYYETQQEGLFWEMLDDDLENSVKPRINDPNLTLDDIKWVMANGTHFSSFFIDNLKADLCPVFKAGIELAY